MEIRWLLNFDLLRVLIFGKQGSSARSDNSVTRGIECFAAFNIVEVNAPPNDGQSVLNLARRLRDRYKIVFNYFLILIFVYL